MSAGRELQPKRLEGKIHVSGDAAASRGGRRLSGERATGKLGQQTPLSNKLISGGDLLAGPESRPEKSRGMPGARSNLFPVPFLSASEKGWERCKKSR